MIETGKSLDEFRGAVRRFIDENLPADIRRKLQLGFPADRDDIQRWHQILHRHGMSTPAWPEEYGGPGWTPEERSVFYEELFTAPAPEPQNFNSNMVGPLIAQFGTDEQKARFLPKIASLEYWFCLGMSEPGAGSDLASLRTAAILDGDEYIVNGQKVWTSTAHHANWVYCLVRTSSVGKKQAGITVLLIELDTPGIEIRPIISIDRRHHFNEVFFDNVRVPVANRIGLENEGWAYARYLNGRERTGIARVGLAKEKLDFARRLLEERRKTHPAPFEEHEYRKRFALLDAELAALDMTQLRSLEYEASDPLGAPVELASMLKIGGAETVQEASRLAMEIAGQAGLRIREVDEQQMASLSDEELAVSSVVNGYSLYRAVSIYGGANEIQRDIIARKLLEG